MTDMRARPQLGAAAASVTGGSWIMERRGLRAALLWLAVVILLLGAAAAALSGYRLMNRGPAASTGIALLR